MVSDMSSNSYVLRVVNAAEKERLSELRNVLSELDLAIRLREISQKQKNAIIHEIKKAIANEQDNLPDRNNDSLEITTRGENYASNDDLIDLIAMLNRGRHQ
ncbi:hypothetical protein EXA76_17025 [Salmonella enterica subsp. enterica serovar Stanleyville]|nr:hypothetical protein [Salmonella enterica subsp. enterica serovar Stanleyville]ECF2999954.1 hypothetical protein [Salmonella enterica subsp. enterica serovar Stanleyville]ECG3771481.1 hypothetical protein [Salmonella enterica subsp. enterica serovar Stanleyville]EEN0464804.1 hypothetical protein [Salmonella enterica subsp. enterica serovar Stanleyville]EIW7558454.1 hypothetical protein [Salmonella enterica subsp. enterica serovar Stanleyville]